MTALVVTLGSDITFNNGVADGNGTLWYLQDIEGWDSPTLRQELLNPVSRHGAYLAQSLFDTRPVILRGIAKTTSEANYWASYNNLLSATSNLLTTKTLQVAENGGGGTKYVNVVRGGAPRIMMTGQYVFEFEIPLLAMDPFKYAPVAANSLAVAAGAQSPSLVNAGNFESWDLVFTITTAGTLVLSNPTVSGSAVLNFGTNSLAIGTVIDFKKRTVLSSTGVNLYNYLASTSVWWPLLSGTNSTTKSGTAAGTYTYRSAYL